MIFFLLLAVAGFVLSLFVHLSTFGAQPIGMGQSWPLHLGIFIVFVPMIIARKRWGDPSDSEPKKSKSLAEQFPFVPPWMRVILGVFFSYAAVNFVLMIVYTAKSESGGKLTTQDGRHVVMKNHQVVREVSDAEFQYHEVRVARGFSGHWMMFYAAAAVGLYDAMGRRRAARALLVRQKPAGGSDLPTPRYAGRSPLLTPFSHAVAGQLVTAVGFLGLPAVMFLVFSAVMRTWRLAGCCFIPVFFGSAIFGMILAPTLFRQWTTARCPACGGRAHAVLEAGNRSVYTCRDCGHVQVVKL